MSDLRTHFIERLRASESVCYLDNQLFLFRDHQFIPNGNYPVKMDLTLCCICIRGSITGQISLRSYRLEAPGIFLVLPNQILQHDTHSPDFSGLFIVMTREFLESLQLPMQFESYQTIMEHPVIVLRKGELRALVDYYRMLRGILGTDNPYRTEVVRHLTAALYYGVGYYFHHLSDTVPALTKQQVLTQRFVRLVQRHYRKQRRLDFYAGQLHVTPKHLSKTVRASSGRSAGEWIDRYVVTEAKALLKSTDMTIQQISDELNFSSQSFFGKYFRRHVGVSPKKYR